ncbi:hypothetical protein BH09BAC5_BH09BAC5_01870 [soil metagenome]
MKEFSFAYITVKNTVSIDDYIIKVKTGPFIKKEFAQNNLQHFYMFDNKDYRSVYFQYIDDKGKLKKIQVMASPAETGFTEMIKELETRFPAKSLNQLSEAEAFKIMKTANPKKWAPFVAFIIIALVMGIGFYPGLRHYFDYGFSEVNVEQLISGEYSGSRNISLSGYLLDKSLEETTKTTRNGSTTTTVSEYVPLVDSMWEEGDPVKVILSFDKLTDDEYNALFDTLSHVGVIRNIAWEGLSKSQISFFKDHYGLKMDAAPILVEITNKKHNDAWAFYALLGCLGVMAIIFVIVAVKRRKG